MKSGRKTLPPTGDVTVYFLWALICAAMNCRILAKQFHVKEDQMRDLWDEISVSLEWLDKSLYIRGSEYIFYTIKNVTYLHT